MLQNQTGQHTSNPGIQDDAHRLGKKSRARLKNGLESLRGNVASRAAAMDPTNASGAAVRARPRTGRQRASHLEHRLILVHRWQLLVLRLYRLLVRLLQRNPRPR